MQCSPVREKFLNKALRVILLNSPAQHGTPFSSRHAVTHLANAHLTLGRWLRGLGSVLGLEFPTLPIFRGSKWGIVVNLLISTCGGSLPLADPCAIPCPVMELNLELNLDCLFRGISDVDIFQSRYLNVPILNA